MEKPMTEDQIFEMFASLDADAVDFMGKAVDVLLSEEVSFDRACDLLRAHYQQQTAERNGTATR